ncbi:MAG: DsbA family protein [Hyphomicrobiales bacterium]|nr:DsbA family protein [Hyphomicrobiales bacterium]
MKFSRRDTLVLGAAASLAGLCGTGAALAQDAPEPKVDVAKLMKPAGNTDHPLGPANAKVTLIEYASPTCPHCALFATTVFEPLKQKYVDTGKMQFILRPFLRNTLDAVVFLLAEAAGPTKYYDVIATFFKTQDQWAASDKPKDAILAVAKQLGFTDDSFNVALTNQPLFDGMKALLDQATKEFGVTGTPTFFLNGQQMTGERSLDQFSAAIDPLLA